MNLLAETWVHGATNIVANASVGTTDVNAKGWGFAAASLSLATGTLRGLHGNTDSNDYAVFIVSQPGNVRWNLTTLGHTPQATLIWGWRTDAPATQWAAADAFACYDSTQATTFVHCRISATGVITAYRGTGTTNLIGTSAAGAWPTTVVGSIMVEIKVTVDPTVGTVDIVIQGTNVLSISGANTGSGLIGVVGFGFANRQQDHYCNDTTGSHNNSFAGDIRNEWVPVIADGNYLQLIPSASIAHWSLVNEHGANSANYVYSQTPGVKDSYQIKGLISTVGIILAVRINGLAKKLETPVRGVKAFCRYSGTDGTAGIETILPNDFSLASFDAVYEVNPATSSAWAISDINNGIEAGVVVST